VLAASAIRIVREYERAVVFRPGRLRGARGPGLVLIIPLIERTRGVNLQVHTADIHVNAVEHAIEEATHQSAQIVVMRHDVDWLTAHGEVAALLRW